MILTEEQLHQMLRYLERGLTTDGDQHKQWYLYKIAELLGISLDGIDKGIAPSK